VYQLIEAGEGWILVQCYCYSESGARFLCGHFGPVRESNELSPPLKGKYNEDLFYTLGR
jgi:hypothetical protein